MNFTKVVKTRMKELDINITALAGRMGYSINYISDLLKGDRRWNETTMAKACEVLKLEARFVPSEETAA
ncbi:helix-turn-helix domain-containing protein [Anaeroselena agilis]|uniref:Helix-turn-helix transcriptional regulator n=1 Tax=Anaeroselena agilis TaxID=3063788 RepID=A0ABU3NYK0_9FIRM|nr:helix-turn-helix transcriptional regulator [Selenomonadales bacterium 4137-cl]